MRFGLDRMRRMMTALASPERGFQSIHVVGTNGKSSTTRMIAAILERHGLRTGAYLSPHLRSYTERVRISERDISEYDFAKAVAAAARAAERVNRTLAEDDHVTQFELLTAAAFFELDRRRVQVGVIEAGLGGRYDATSVIDSSVTVLTGVGLEHTRWLGPTLRDIAAEKLAVLREGTTLVLPADVDPEVLALAHDNARSKRARVISPETGYWETMLATQGSFQRRNFALAKAASEAYLTGAGMSLEQDAVAAAARETLVPGRLQRVGESPLTIFDGAHNPDAVRALCESLDELAADRQIVLVLGVLDDKDAAGMLKLLLGRCARAWFTAPPSARALSPAALESLARQQGFENAVCEPDCERALDQAQDFACENERDTLVLATGSIYLIGALLAHLETPRPSLHGPHRQEDRPIQRNTTR
jgi:dihydrofolate synthase / folylpolyglutamate synthase